MRLNIIACAAASALVLWLCAASARPLDTIGESREVARAPKGWVGLCKRYSEECAGPNGTPRVVELNGESWKELVAINNSVNSTIKPLSDAKHWYKLLGVTERWDYAEDGYGDCEDYALLKRKKLMALGFPREALRITVVWASGPKGDEGHAVLMVRTSKGDFVLDNRQDEVMLWHKTRFDFVKWQSAEDPNRWVYIDKVTADARRHRATIATAARP